MDLVVEEFNATTDTDPLLSGDIELTATRNDLPENLKVPDAVKSKLGNYRPSYVCRGNGDTGNGLTFIHFIYKNRERAELAAEHLFKERLIFSSGHNGAHSSNARAVNVHTTAPNACQEYRERGFAFFRVHVDEYYDLFKQHPVKLLDRDSFLEALVSFESELNNDDPIFESFNSQRKTGCIVC